MASGAALHRWLGGVALAASVLSAGVAGAQAPGRCNGGPNDGAICVQLPGQATPVTCTGGTCTAALVTSDHAAGVLIFPKIVSDPGGVLSGGVARDTLIQITNIVGQPRSLHCFYVDATSRCFSGVPGSPPTGSNIDPTGVCETTANCVAGSTCVPDWGQIDFDLTLTPEQQIGWLASGGLTRPGVCVDGPRTGQECDVSNVATDCPGGTPTSCQLLPGSVNNVPARAPGVFVGELKCIEVASEEDGAILPIFENDMIGQATIYDVSPDTVVAATAAVDARSYNAIGVQAIGTAGTGLVTQSDGVLCLGATAGSTECTTAEYAACPTQLVLDHFFDSAVVATNVSVSTEVTFVPCSEDLESDSVPAVNTLQFLVFNEFEQRFSASARVQCFREVQLSNLDRFPGQEATSIFNVAVQGSLTGQTRIRAVDGNETEVGHGMLAIAEEFRTGAGGNHSSAFNLNYIGLPRAHGDFLRFVP